MIIEEFRMIVEIDHSHKSNTRFFLSMEDPDLQIYLLSLCDNRQDVYWCWMMNRWSNIKCFGIDIKNCCMVIGALFSYVIAFCARPYFGIMYPRCLNLRCWITTTQWIDVGSPWIFYLIIFKKLFHRFDDWYLCLQYKPVYEQRTSRTHFLL